MATDTLTTIRDNISSMVSLEILTVVGNFELTEDRKQISSESLTGTDKIFSRIGLVDGDIETAMSPVFVTDPTYREIWAFHQQQVENGHVIMQRNIEALGKLVNFIRNELDKGTKA